MLRCYLGMVQQAQGKTEAALKNLEAGIDLAPRNPLVLFNYAMVLHAGGRHEDALAQLAIVKEAAPKEPAVYTLMSKIYKKMGHEDKATFHSAWAADLDPKGSNTMIKEAIERHQLPEDDDEPAMGIPSTPSAGGGMMATPY